MRALAILITLIFVIQSAISQNCDKFKVESIDSTTNNYIIDLTLASKRYVVISTKEKPENQLDKIEVGKKYKFELIKSNLTDNFQIDKNFRVNIEGKNVWKNGDDFEIYFTENLIGLYYIK